MFSESINICGILNIKIFKLIKNKLILFDEWIDKNTIVF